MGKLFVIMGKSFSGKNYLLNKILNEKEFCEDNNIKKLVRYTNRPMREGEIDGVTYHFIENKDLEGYIHNKSVVSSYDTQYGTWHYITDLSKLEKDTNYITDADINDIIEYKKILPLEDICIIYLIPPNWKIFQRFSERNDYGEDRYKEIYRRFVDDTYKFYYKSNEVLAGVKSIINVGTELNMDFILSNMAYDENIRCKICTKGETFAFESDYDYIDDKYERLYNPISFNTITILNDEIQIDTELESVYVDSDYIE